jgi:hypothetical protein
MAAKRDWIVSIDWENNGDEFWQNMNARDDVPPELRMYLNGFSDLTNVTARKAKQLIAYVETVQGWFDGPTHARHPLIICEDSVSPQARKYLSVIGRKGGASKSKSKSAASRANGAKGGRPKATR